MSDGRSGWLRALRGGLAAALFLVLAGDRGAQSALVGGIDPLEILKLQVKNNVAIVFDTSGSMKWPVDIDFFSVGGDDPMSRLYQAKQAVKAVVQANAARLNFGLLTYNIASGGKTLNRSQNFDNDINNGVNTNRIDGPFVYVSADAPGLPSNAGVFYNTFNCNGAANVDGYFCQIDNTFGNYNTNASASIFRSFGNRRGTATTGLNLFSDPYPVGCTPGVDCRYYLQSRLFRSNVSFTWNMLNPTNVNTVLLSGPNAIACPLPPVGIVGDNPDLNGDGFSDRPTPCIQFVAGLGGPVSTFYYTSAVFQENTGNACGGALAIARVPDCVTDNSQAILDQMRPELPFDNNLTLGSGSVVANNLAVNYTAGTNPTVFGVRADQSTPIAGSLSFVRTASPPIFPPPQPPPPVGPLQKNFVIVLSDGDDTCANAGDQDGNGTSNDLDDRAIFSARQAQQLFANTANPQNQAETLFVAFASAINIGRSNKIAQAGSGGLVQANGTVLCPVGATCRNAFTATSTDELIRVLNAALDQAVGSAEFSAAPTILSTVFELGPLTDPLLPADPDRVDPMNPNTRYNSRVNVLYTPTFEMPGFGAHFYAFLNDGSFQPVGQANFTGRWDAGETLFEQVTQVLEATTGGASGRLDLFTFGELHGGFTPRNIATALAPVIKRRIFTSSPANLGVGESPVNRSFVRSGATPAEWDGSAPEGANVVALWPPSQAGLDSGVTDIDPAVGVVGPLDDALGIGPNSNPVLTFGQLRSLFRACEGSVDSGGPPTACDDVADPVLALDTARKEARQVLLAWIAGARVAIETPAPGGTPVPTSDNKALRLAGSCDPAALPGTTTACELLYRDRGWLMLDSTLGAPAIVGPPLRATPSEHVREFLLFRDGRRDPTTLQGINDLDRGFGLRNPDFDDANPETKIDLKPTMTVVYLPANDMLHAFRAGPNCGPPPGQAFDPTTCQEQGSQELWGFVPYDQLGKIQLLLQGQLEDPHTYVMGSSVRVSDIFIPEPFTLGGFSFDGRWRTVLFFGRGPGGKFYTALDVTVPGPFTRRALDANPPFVMWNHGNEDPVAGVDPASDDDYDDMGQSWSVPAVGNVDVSTAGLPEWRVWVGSGYGDLPNEGATFYMLDAVTGNVLYSKVVGDGTATFVAENALVASPAAYNAFQLDDPTVATRSADRVTRVYIPDIHGRLWKFNTTSGGQVANEGPSQPFGVGVALLKLDDGSGQTPHIYAAAGNDRRVPDTNPFKLFGYDDAAADTDLSTPLTKLFEVSMPGPVAGVSEGFRGTVQPATAFSRDTNGQVFGRVFFVGTRFNLTTVQCISTFDTILFGLGAISGSAVYDFNNDGTADMSTIVQGQRATNVQTAGGQVIIGDSGAIGRPPSPPPPPSSLPSPGPPSPAQIITRNLKAGSPVCRID